MGIDRVKGQGLPDNDQVSALLRLPAAFLFSTNLPQLSGNREVIYLYLPTLFRYTGVVKQVGYHVTNDFFLILHVKARWAEFKD